MKKAIIILGLVFFSMQSYAQAGDLYFGLQGGYATYYKAPLYGLNISYDIANPLQVSLTGLMNPSFTTTTEWTLAGGEKKIVKEKWELFSVNLDARLFLINMESWATGPSLGAQWLSYKFTTSDNSISFGDDDNLLGFNIGWHLRINITDNLRASGGWRFSNMKESDNYNLFYLSIGYAFNLF